MGTGLTDPVKKTVVLVEKVDMEEKYCSKINLKEKGTMCPDASSHIEKVVGRGRDNVVRLMTDNWI